MRRIVGGMGLALVLLALSAAHIGNVWEGPGIGAGGPLAAGNTPEEALAAYFSAGNLGYAGDCAMTESPRDIGKVCSTLVDQRQNLVAYLTGRTFSEYGLWLFLRYEQGRWVVVATVPLDFFAAPLVVPWPR